MDCGPSGSSVHEIFQAKILEWVAISFSRGSSGPGNWTWFSCTAGKFLHCRQILYQLSDDWEKPNRYTLSSVHLLSHVQLFVTSWAPSCQASIHYQLRGLLKLMSIESVIPSKHLILCRPLLLPSSIFPTIRVFSNESALHIRWPKYWNFSFSISPSNEYSGLISFRMDWLDLLAVQGILKSLLQYHSSKASIFWHSAFFTVQLLHPYMTTGKTIALTRRTDTHNYIQNR